MKEKIIHYLHSHIPLLSIVIILVLALTLPVVVFLALSQRRLLTKAACPVEAFLPPKITVTADEVGIQGGSSLVMGKDFTIRGFDLGCEYPPPGASDNWGVKLKNIRDARTNQLVLGAEGISLKVKDWVHTKITAVAPTIGAAGDSFYGDLYVKRKDSLQSEMVTIRLDKTANVQATIQPQPTVLPSPTHYLEQPTPTFGPSPTLYPIPTITPTPTPGKTEGPDVIYFPQYDY